MKPMVVGLAVCVVGFLLFEYF
ncbi:MAG: hypothetical protein JWL81_1551, partial [Verrucomicrobiales bacterium]|nr:hypothetical protein [Verrucomicrobiales bacterium]